MKKSAIKSIICFCFVTIGIASFSGCESYATPGAGAQMNVFLAKKALDVPATDPTGTLITPGRRYSTESGLGSSVELARQNPTAVFPVHMVTVRVQEPEYSSYTNRGHGRGNYSVVTTRDIEKEEDFDRLGKLDGIAQISPLSRLLLPEYLNSDEELRLAAARLHADMVLIYTLDTYFYDHDSSVALSVISLGLAPTIEVKVTTTISVIVMDTRTGFIYGILEETARKEQNAAALGTKDAFDQMRQDTERQAFEKFLDEFQNDLWRNILRQHRK